MADDQAAYDPDEPAAPAERPPLRETAPQSAFTATQVGIGLVVLLIGLAITIGLGVTLA